MKVMRFEVERLHLFLGNLDSASVGSAIQTSFDSQPGLGRSSSNQIDDTTVVRQWPTSPICADERKQTMLDFVPFAGPRWEVTHRDRQFLLGREVLQLALPQLQAIPIATSAIGADQQTAGSR